MWTRFVVWLAKLTPKQPDPIPGPAPEPHSMCKAAIDAWLASKPADIPAQPLHKYLITFRNGTVLVHRAHRYSWSRETNLRFYRDGAVTFTPVYGRDGYQWRGDSNTTESFVCRTASVTRVELIDSDREQMERNQ